MITTLTLSNFTVFKSAELEFSKGLNVIVGENGAGKTHLLKMLYSVPAASREEGRRAQSPPTKAGLQNKIAAKLIGVFRPDTLGRLVRRRQGHSRCEVAVGFAKKDLNAAFSFSTRGTGEVQLSRVPTSWEQEAPAYLPTRELLSIYPNFVSTYETVVLEFDETWRDTCLLLGAPLRRGPRHTNDVLGPLEEAMQGRIELNEVGRFYLRSEAGLIEIPLVAEGVRKLAMIARLVQNETLAGTGYLFWDEPEANLNPRLIRQVAATILALGKANTQVFIATHSLFLLREIEIGLANSPGTNCRFFGLTQGPDGVAVSQGSDIDDVGPIVALEEELQQSDRFMEAVNGPD